MEPKNDELKALLEKYYAGETSLAEEAKLDRWLQQENARPLLPDQRWFAHLREARREDAPPDTDARLQQQIRMMPTNGPSRFKSRKSLQWLSGMAAVLVLGLGLYWIFYGLPFTASSLEQVITTTTPRQVELPDGSKVWLNADSYLRFPAVFENAERRVWLGGEAFFDVRRDSLRPFRVQTNRTTTTVLGTSFNIRSYAADSIVGVIVVSGKVAFGPEESGWPRRVTLLTGNEGIWHPGNQRLEKVLNSDPNKLAWKTHRLSFADVPLREVIPVLEQYFRVTIRVQNPALLACRFRGTFQQAPLEEVLQVMTYGLNLTYRQQAGQYELQGNGCR